LASAKKIKSFLETILPDYIKLEPARSALKNIMDVYSGDLWIIGGYINRIVVSKIYDKPEALSGGDLDIMLAEKFDLKLIPTMKDWRRLKNKYGGLKLRNKNLKVDIFYIQNEKRLSERNLTPTIDNYLATAPLTAHSIAYDVKKNRIIGDIGLLALESQTVKVNDYAVAEKLAKNKKISIKDLVQKKADDLGFRPIF